MDIVFLIARVLFAALFLLSALGHLTQADAMGGYATSKGVPAGKAATLVTGVMILVGGLMVLLGVWGDLGALLLAAFVIPTAFLMHNFWKETDPMAKQTEMVGFNKNIALGGGALALFVVFNAFDDLGLTITGPLF